MRRTIWLASFAVVVAAFAVALTAQSYGNTQSSSQSSSSTSDKVIVTGCVQRSSDLGTATGTSGTSGQTPPDTQFVLTNATQGSETGSSAMGTSGSSTSSSFSEYRLDDAAQAKISPHVGHKVQITGTLENEGSSSSSSSYGSSGTSGTSSGSSMSSNLPKLKVDSVKMISSSCSSER